MFYTFLIWELIYYSENVLRKKTYKKVSMIIICICILYKTQKCSEYLFEIIFI